MVELRNRSKKSKKGDVTATSTAEGSTGDKNVSSSSTSEDTPQPPVPLRYGRMPTFSGQRLWSRSALILGLMTVVYFSSKVKESNFAKYGEKIQGKAFDTKCSSRIEDELNRIEGCQLQKCGRVLTDSLIDVQEVFWLSDLSNRVFSLIGNQESGIYEIFTGKLIHDKETEVTNNTAAGGKLKTGDAQHLNAVESSARRLISEHFKIDYWKIQLSTGFFMQITPHGKKKNHMTKPIVHIDAFGSQFAAIVYLSDFGKDGIGGRLIFPDSDSTNRTIEGQKGRVIAFTSGLENQHVIEPMTKGKLIILVLGYTCDNKKLKSKTTKLP